MYKLLELHGRIRDEHFTEELTLWTKQQKSYSLGLHTERATDLTAVRNNIPLHKNSKIQPNKNRIIIPHMQAAADSSNHRRVSAFSHR